MKILFHTFPGYTLFAKEVIAFARNTGVPIDWSVILYSDSESVLDDLTTLVGKNNVLYLQDHLNAYMEKGELDLSELREFPGSIFDCVSTSKVHYGHISLQKQDRRYQLMILAGTYAAYKKFLLANRPDYVFFPLIEMYDSMVLHHLCRELGITPIIYGHSRNLGATYFTDSIYETLPSYAFSRKPAPEIIAKADSFIRGFRAQANKAFVVSYHPTPDEIIETPSLRNGIMHKAVRFVKIRLGMMNLPLVKRYLTSEPYVTDRYTLLHNLRIHFISLTRSYRGLKVKVRRFPYDIRSTADLPEKFVYCPLQYSPESSINTPAPFFTDQLRAVDLIRNALPADHYLVVRDHPAMVAERPFAFYRSLTERAGVLLADPAVPNLDILTRASLTVSVTGTSCLEAFLLGRPSLQLGRSFFTDWIHSFDRLSDFKKVVREAIGSREVPYEKIVDLVSRVYSIGSDFALYSAGGDAYGDRDLLLNTRNFRVFLDALQKHIADLKADTP